MIEEKKKNDRTCEGDRQSAEETLRILTEATAAVTGGDFFTLLVRNLADAIRTRYAFIAECTDETRTEVRTLAFWSTDRFADDITFRVHGTPCEKVVGGDVCCYPQSLQSLFPEDTGLVRLRAESYLGVPLYGSSGKVLGHLVVLDDKPMAESINRNVPVLRIFAARAGAELERKRFEDALQRSQEHVRALLDINNAIITKRTRDELFSAICDSLKPVVSFDRIALALHDSAANILRLVTFAGPYQRTDYTPIGRELSLTDSPAGLAFSRQTPTLRRDLEKDRRTGSEERAFSHGFRSLCALPLIVRGKSIGAITVGSLTREQYSEIDVSFLTEVAKQISIAVDNMQSYEEIVALKSRIEAENVYLQEEIKTEYNFEEIIGKSASLRQVLRKIEQVAPTEASVLIQGETGTGKELLARAIHNLSRRKSHPLVKVNCGAIPSGLVESELFGHEKGAFTGALQRREGRFELADGGTIFLDEVGELPLDVQAKLLRVLQEGEFERVGSSKTINVNVRLIAATNRDLKEAVKSGVFRSDLFYRLSVFPIRMPALKERKADIPLLVSFFISRFTKKVGKQIQGVSKDTMERLIKYPWPGNIRELQNLIERAVVLANGPVLKIDDATLGIESGLDAAPIALEDVERAHILRTLAETNWVVHGNSGAANILGINPSTLRSRMLKLGIKRDRHL